MSTASITAQLEAATAELREVKHELRELKLVVHELVQVVRTKIAEPVEMLTTAEAAKRARVCTRTVLKWIALGFLSDRRAGMGKGAHRVMSDELEVLLTDGADSCRRFRNRMGRS